MKLAILLSLAVMTGVGQTPQPSPIWTMGKGMNIGQTPQAPSKAADQTTTTLNNISSWQAPTTLQFNGFVLKTNRNNFNGDLRGMTLSFDQPGSGRIDRLSDEEYAKLQKLRQAVVDAETEIAESHGVKLHECTTCLTSPPPRNDTYQFRGQFLLINVPQSASLQQK